MGGRRLWFGGLFGGALVVVVPALAYLRFGAGAGVPAPLAGEMEPPPGVRVSDGLPAAERPPDPRPPAIGRPADPPRGAADSSRFRSRPPAPPAGYTFVSPPVRMTVGPMEPAPDRAPLPDRRMDWLGSLAGLHELEAQAARAGRGWTFGWLRMAGDATPAAVGRELARFGGAVIGSTGRLLRVTVPGELVALTAIVGSPAVAALGAMPVESKLSPSLSTGPAGEPMRVFVTLMTDDPDGRWGRALAELGATPGRFDPAIRVYTASVPGARIAELAAADFVQSVEPVGVVRALHDTAVPAMGADLLRTRAGGGRYLGVGGSSVPIGVMDTGLNVRHVDIASGRASICGANFAEGEGRGADEDLWIDEGAHGTHVTGTIAGAGLGEPRYAGMAPAVRDIRFAKVLNVYGAGLEDWTLRGMDYLAEASGCDAEDPPRLAKPLVVNVSLSDCGLEFEARTTSERKLDATVWSARQLYVVANSNDGRACFSDFGAAKNALAVGAIRDDGRIADFSSRGPTADGRLLPKLSATGVGLYSARGGGNRSGYDRFSGTSMASPSAAGVAALLMDAAPAHGGMPALARARLMASAIRPDVWLESDSAFPATNTDGPGRAHAAYGLGKVSAPLTVLQRDEPDGWTTGGAVAALRDGEYGHVDIDVPEGASRLDIVMTWDEPPAETIADPVLNDLDLWLDHDPDCGAAACGEHSSRSRVDNVEWIVVRNPPAGRWRAKVTARRVYTAPPRAALAWTVIRGKSTPRVSVAAAARPLGRDRTRIEARLTTDGFVASGVGLGLGCRAMAGSDACYDVVVQSAATRRPDGVETDVRHEVAGLELRPGATVSVGELVPGRPRTVRLTVSHPPGERILLMLTASAWNGVGESAGIRVGVGDLGPPAPAAPPNDAFADAMEIAGATGSRAVDLLRATPDPAGRAFGGTGNWRRDRPRGTVWYRWTGASTGLAAFAVELDGDPHAHRLDIYGGEDFAALESLASGSGEVVFLAESGASYRVRLSDVSAGHRATLRWRPGTRPAHDDFADAATLEGERGMFASSNGGGTLEPGEWFGGTVATVWHRWTAPRDGWWSFERAGRSNVAVFEGDRWENVRLVSGFEPGGSAARFPAGAGREYRIVVGGESAFRPVGEYTLGWHPWEGPGDNDEIESAAALDGAATGTHSLVLQPSRTVSPDEPAETGVKTAWWTWKAPEAGRYTFRIDAADALVAVFAGSAVDDLSPVGRIAPRGGVEDTAFDAEADQEFWISAGFAARGRAAYTDATVFATLAWGPAPANDTAASAAPLSGTGGSVSGNTRYATTGPEEPRLGLGRSTVWWSYEAGASGWIEVEVAGGGGPWSLAVLREGPDGALEIVRSSRWRRGSAGSAEVTFEALEGIRYAIAVGVHGDAEGGQFDLRWAAVDAPAWLRYVGRLEPWGADARGTTVELRGPSAMATAGAALYLASEVGLQVFRADPESGGLTLRQTLRVDLEGRPMVWDEQRSRLLVQGDSCDAWRVFHARRDGLRLVDRSILRSVGDTSCSSFDELHVSGDGANLYRNSVGRIDIFAVDPGGEIAHRRTVHGMGAHVALGEDGGFLYAAELGGLATYRRRMETGDLEFLGWEQVALASLDAIAIGDGMLFVVFDPLDGAGPRTAAYALDDPAAPAGTGETSPFLAEPHVEWRFGGDCVWVGARAGAAVGDVVCPGLVYAFRADLGADEIDVTDYAGSFQPDRYDNPVPEFGDPAAVAASADGRHVYVATDGPGILVFRRVGAFASVGSP